MTMILCCCKTHYVSGGSDNLRDKEKSNMLEALYAYAHKPCTLIHFDAKWLVYMYVYLNFCILQGLIWS